MERLLACYSLDSLFKFPFTSVSPLADNVLCFETSPIGL